MIIVNTPHNPVGKVYNRQELEKIAALAEEHNLIVMSDEVVRDSVPSDEFLLTRNYFAPCSMISWCSMAKSTFG